MTEPTPDPVETAEEAFELEPFRRSDYLLESLVSMVSGDDNRSETRFTLGVVLQGMTVVGELCSNGQWIKSFADIATGDENGRAFVDALAEVFDNSIPTNSADPATAPPRQYFHMVNVTIITPQLTSHSHGFRGLLGEVGGWFFPSSYPSSSD